VTPTLYVATLTGPGVIHLSLHTRREGAVARVATEGRDAWGRAFGYELPPTLSDEAVAERLDAEGWVSNVDEVEVEL
jgi:hypothetical protein